MNLINLTNLINLPIYFQKWSSMTSGTTSRITPSFESRKVRINQTLKKSRSFTSGLLTRGPTTSREEKGLAKIENAVNLALEGELTEDGGRRTEDGGQRSEVGGQRSESGGQTMEEQPTDSGTRTQVVMVVGEPGSGKSALLAKFVQNLTQPHPSIPQSAIHNPQSVIPVFVGASNRSTNPRHILTDLCSILANEFGIEEDIPDDMEKLKETFQDFLKKADRKVVIVIDAVNQLQKEENAREMRWLPERFPENVCVVVSLVEDKREKGEGYDIEADTTALNAMRNRPVKPFEIGVEKLSDDERKVIINSYLSLFNKQLMPDMQDILVGKEEAYNPLYLTVALEELRVFSKHEELEDFLQNRIPNHVVDMFDFVLNRVEKDLKARFEVTEERNLFSEFMVNLATGRDGMYEDDLRLLFGRLAGVKRQG